MDRSIDLCILWDVCHELLNYVLKDFYASGAQDAEVTNHCGKIHSQVKAGFTYHQGKLPANNINSESN